MDLIEVFSEKYNDNYNTHNYVNKESEQKPMFLPFDCT